MLRPPWSTLLIYSGSIIAMGGGGGGKDLGHVGYIGSI